MRRRYTSRWFEKRDNRDRIEKAADLIIDGGITAESDGCFVVISESGSKRYRVTLVSCECEDFHHNTDLCKHQWASWGAPAAQHILRIRRALSVAELENWTASYADELCFVPEPFLAVVRQEYRDKLKALYEASKARTA